MNVTFTIENNEVVMRTPEGRGRMVTLRKFLKAICSTRGIQPSDTLLPRGVIKAARTEHREVWIYQRDPQVYSLRWSDTPKSQAPYVYRTVRLAFPYLIVVVVFKHLNGIGPYMDTNSCSVFFTNKPVTSVSDKLYYPAMPNCANAGHRESWMCLPYEYTMRPGDRRPSMAEQLSDYVRAMLETGFNNDADPAEYCMSHFKRTIMAKVDPRLASVDTWEKASIKDPAFAVTVPWLPSKLDVASVIDSQLFITNAQINTSADLAEML